MSQEMSGLFKYILRADRWAEYEKITSDMAKFEKEVETSLQLVVEFLARHENNANAQKQGECLYMETCMRSESQMMWFHHERIGVVCKQLADVVEVRHRRHVFNVIATYVRIDEEYVNSDPQIKQDTIDKLARLEEQFADQ